MAIPVVENSWEGTVSETPQKKDSERCIFITPESGIDVGQGITVGP